MSTTFCLRRPNPLLLVNMIKLMINNSSNVDDEPMLAEGRLVCVPDHLFGSHLNHYHPDDPFSFVKLVGSHLHYYHPHDLFSCPSSSIPTLVSE